MSGVTYFGTKCLHNRGSVYPAIKYSESVTYGQGGAPYGANGYVEITALRDIVHDNAFYYQYVPQLLVRVSNAGHTTWRPGVNGLAFFSDVSCSEAVPIPRNGGWDSPFSECPLSGCEFCSGYDYKGNPPSLSMAHPYSLKRIQTLKYHQIGMATIQVVVRHFLV